MGDDGRIALTACVSGVHPEQVGGDRRGRNRTCFPCESVAPLQAASSLDATDGRLPHGIAPCFHVVRGTAFNYITFRTHAVPCRFAILSIVLGYLVNGSLPLSETQRPSATVDLARPAPAPVVNASASFSTPVTTPTGMALISSSFKDIALAAISPYALASTSTSSVATKAVPSPTQALGKNAEQASAPSECSCGCGLITWPDKFKEATDVALRSTPSMPSVGGSTFQKDGALAFGAPAAADKGKGKARAAEDSLYALSTRLAGALTEYLDMRTIFAQTGQDLQELFDALDDLARAVERQAGSAYAQSKSTLEVVRERIRTRHERARSRAKELREVGERLFSSVSEQMRGRVATAKENARGVRDNVRLLREEGRARRQGRSERRRERKRWARRAATAE